MIRRLFTFLLICVLIGLSSYNYLQLISLRAQNKQLIAKNALLRSELSKHRPNKGRRGTIETVAVNSDPVGDAQLHLAQAEKAVSAGNIGEAVSDCRAAGTDIAAASNSTSGNVRGSVAALKGKLDSIQHETNDLLQKLGA